MCPKTSLMSAMASARQIASSSSMSGAGRPSLFASARTGKQAALDRPFRRAFERQASRVEGRHRLRRHHGPAVRVPRAVEGQDRGDVPGPPVPGGQRRAERPAFPQRPDHRRVPVLVCGSPSAPGSDAEMAMAGTRRPERSNAKPICPAGAARSGGATRGGGTW